MKPFLSCVSMLLSYLNLLVSPPELSDGQTTWSLLCLALGLPDTLCAMFDADGSSLEPQAQKWIKKFTEDQRKYDLNISHISFPNLVNIPSLVSLPNDYRTVIELTNNFRCKQRKNTSEPVVASEYSSSPAMCLICGEIMCTLSKCCQVFGGFGGGNHHVKRCGKGVGLFMLIRSSEDRLGYHYHQKQYEACSGIMITARGKKHALKAFK